MVTMFNPKPQLMRSVAKPDNVSTKELAEARPVYIDGLPEGGGGGSSTTDAITIAGTQNDEMDGTPLNTFITGFTSVLDDFEARILALEAGPPAA